MREFHAWRNPKTTIFLVNLLGIADAGAAVMLYPKSNQRANGFTLVEMLVVISIIALLAALLLPALNGGKQRAKRIVCESQLRQIGIAFQSFSHDHNSKFPMEVSTNDGGSME